MTRSGAGDSSARQRPRWGRRLALAYAIALIASHAIAWRRAATPLPLRAGDEVATLAEPVGSVRTAAPLRLVYRDLGPRDGAVPVVLLLHGSPGGMQDFHGLSERLAASARVLVPDLPGFGRSRQALSDYSIEAHADAVLQLVERLGIPGVHAVGFSMGGGVALHLAARAPARVRSVILVGGIGVQELELFGDRDLNHLVHGAQLALFRGADLLLPHFGAIARPPFGTAYARNFYDSDQRPLRGLLERLDAPLLLLHGRRDFLVPPEVALEHHRIVPHSELRWFDRGHFLLWQEPEAVADAVTTFTARCEAGAAPRRRDAAPDRVAAAAAPFDPRAVPPAEGVALAVLLLLLALATLASEDLTCIGAGFLVAAGRLQFWPAALACVGGIAAGDLLLFAVGRWFGRAAVRRAPLRWFVTEERLERGAAFFDRRGLAAVFLARFTPGLRLPTYLAAGVVGTSALRFTAYFLAAAAVWTPLLVLVAAEFLGPARSAAERFESLALPLLAAAVLALLLLQRLVLRLFTWRGRRELVGAWRRIRHWEFWPPYAFYPPVVAYVGALAVRHRGFGVVTAVNPGIPTGGFVGESKSAILDRLQGALPFVARHVLLPGELEREQRLERARRFHEELGGGYPVVLKPDVGQRGSGVQILRDAERLESAVLELGVDAVLQEYAPGPEFGVFYVRRPDEDRGRIVSITEKILPVLEGDGARTLDELLLADPRAVCMLRAYRALHARRLHAVPARGERIQLVELGTHCRGAIFRDGWRVWTPELELRIDAISRGFEGFHFGRYDLRAASDVALAAGREFKIVELNGLTAEPTHVYDSRYPPWYAWKILCAQWRIAFEIGAANRARGAAATSVAELVRAWREYRRAQRRHGAAG